MKQDSTFKELKASGYIDRSINEEMKTTLITKIT
jgi:hypothetical protein